MGAGERQLEYGVFYFPAGVGKGVGTRPPAAGASGHMGQPNYETVMVVSSSSCSLTDRRRVWILSSRAVPCLTSCPQDFIARGPRIHLLVSCRVFSGITEDPITLSFLDTVSNKQ